MAAKHRPTRRTTRELRGDSDARERALDALSRMRSEGVSLTQAARRAHTTRTTVRKHVPRALRRTSAGHYAATASDRYARHLWFLTPDGKVEVTVRGSHAAESVARYMAAVDRYLTKGDPSSLAEFRGRGVRSGKHLFPFLTDTAALDRLAHAGEIGFERLYTRRI